MIEQLRRHARATPDGRAYVFLRDGEDELGSLSWAELDQRAQGSARRLRERAQPGDRIVLAYPQGLDFVISLYACFYAGLVAVPAPPPSRDLEGLRLIAQDADARCLLSSGRLVDAIATELPGITCVRTDEWRDENPPNPGWQPDSTALLLYTSGTTGMPRGVAIHYANLHDNVRQLREILASGPEPCVAVWTPQHHEFGLASLFLAVDLGCPCIVLPTAAVQQKPLRWLKAMTRYRCTVSGGPDTAYQLCADSIHEEQKAGLDLSAWQAAVCTGEPLRWDPLDRFAAAFYSHGFRRSSFRAIYGLAEATLFASATAGEPRISYVGDRHLGLARVSCGRPPAQTRMLIVNPESRQLCPPGEVGEIWLANSSVGAGYWGKPAETSSTFSAHLADGEGPFLRTSDLGFLDDNELYIAGRLPDHFVVRGRSFHPEDLESTAWESHPTLEPGASAVFFHEGKLVVVSEVRRAAQRDLEGAKVVRAIRRALAEKHRANTHTVVLVKPSGLPRTPGGKLRRGALRDAYLGQALHPLASWDFWAEATDAPPPPSPAPEEGSGSSLGGDDFWQGLGAEIRQELTGVMAARSYPEGTVVFHEGDTDGGLFVVLGGEALVEKRLEEDRYELLGIICPGGVFGEMTLFGDAGRSATVRARGELRTLYLGRPEFAAFLAAQPETAAHLLGALLSLVSSRLREATQCLMAVRETSRVLGRELEIPEICQSVLERVMRALPAEGAVVALYEEGRCTPIVGFGLPPDLAAPFPLPPTLVNELMRRTESIRLGPDDPAVAFLGQRWCLLTELSHEGQMLGLVGVLTNSEECPFTPAHAIMLAVVANQAASSVAHARRRLTSAGGAPP